MHVRINRHRTQLLSSVGVACTEAPVLLLPLGACHAEGGVASLLLLSRHRVVLVGVASCVHCSTRVARSCPLPNVENGVFGVPRKQLAECGCTCELSDHTNTVCYYDHTNIQ